MARNYEEVHLVPSKVAHLGAAQRSHPDAEHPCEADRLVQQVDADHRDAEHPGPA